MPLRPDTPGAGGPGTHNAPPPGWHGPGRGGGSSSGAGGGGGSGTGAGSGSFGGSSGSAGPWSHGGRPDPGGGGSGGGGGGGDPSSSGKPGKKKHKTPDPEIVSNLMRRAKLNHFHETFGGSEFYSLGVRSVGAAFKPLTTRNQRDGHQCYQELHHELFGSDFSEEIDSDTLAALLSELGVAHQHAITDDGLGPAACASEDTRCPAAMVAGGVQYIQDVSL